MRALCASLLAALALAGAASGATVRVAVTSLSDPEVAWNLDERVRPDLCASPVRLAALRWRLECRSAAAVAAALRARGLEATARGRRVDVRTAFAWRRLPLYLARIPVPGAPRLRVVSRTPDRIVATRPGLRLEFLRLEPHAAAAAFARGTVDVAPVPLGDLRAALADAALAGEVRVRPLDAVDGVEFDLAGGVLAGLTAVRRAYWLTADREDYSLLVSSGIGPPAFGLLPGAVGPPAKRVRDARRTIGALPPTRVRIAGDPQLAAIPVADWRNLGLGAVTGPGRDRFERLTALYPGPEGLFLALQPHPGPLLRGALAARDPLPALRRLDASLRAQAAFVPLAWVVGARLVSHRLRGWRQDALGLADYGAVRVVPG